MFEYFPQPITASILVEGTVVGILIIIFAYIASAILYIFGAKPVLPAICETWNDTHIMEKSLFLTGFLAHISLELSGINKWYAVNKVNP